jgi:glycosyltransferase involved in cell wall biosynthesis
MRVLWTTSERTVAPAPLVFLNPLASWLRNEGVDIHIHRTGSLRTPWGMRRESRLIQSAARGFDLVHAQYGSACALVTMRATDTPRLMTIRGNDWNLHSETFHWLWLHTRAARRFSRMAIPRADRVLAVSHRIAEELRSAFPARRILYLPTPVDFRKFRPATPEERSSRAALRAGADPGSFWVLFNALNPWDPIKRFQLARDAVRMAQSKLGLPVQLVLASSIPHDRIASLTRACDAILSTSESEGWPNCVKEALASNVPFIATDTSDLRRIAEADHRCQIVEANAHAIAQALARLVQADWRGHHDGLRDHVGHMQLPYVGHGLISTYQDLLKGIA